MCYFMQQNINNKGDIKADARLKYCDTVIVLVILIYFGGHSWLYCDFNLTVHS